ncbi:LytTR family DNA-binding domain-containing protein [uncultured Psychroserpens sp.]|uniref:LytR/AlgR family response regulator transcription factor n=1 Tax=uncultured Psychroserpens sp. TaxID=255436 RepID=UPI00261438D6|nr:LytTR family DNA-binding domain-containing protein [uncultured Psychroserpens sp.]
MIKCLILEDESSALELLKSYIEKTPFLECIGSFESGLDISTEVLHKTDVLFLDIQLPELNGLLFLRTLVNPPIVIVTSAFPNYALDAFEEAVTDYLLKPFSYERFYKSVSRVRYTINKKEVSKTNQILLYTNKTTFKVNLDDILYLKAEIDYVHVITNKRNILILDSLNHWSERLKTYNFYRIHRSYIINHNHIEKIKGNQVFINNKPLPIGRTYKADFINKFKKNSI